MQIKLLLLIVFFSVVYANISDIYKYVDNVYKLQAIDKDIQIKKLDIQQAKNNYYPQFNTKLSYNIDDLIEDMNDTKKDSFNRYSSLEFTISQKLVDFQISPLIEKAKNNLKYTQANKEYYLDQILFKLIPMYVSIIENKKILKLLSEKINNFKNIIKELESKNQFKFASKIDILKAKKQYLDLKNKYLQVKYENMILKKTLQQLLNHSISFEEKNINPPNNLPQLDSKNPELKMYQYKIEIAKSDASIKRAKLYPNINLNLQYTIDSYNTYNQREFFGDIAINIPFFNKSDTTNYQAAKINVQKEVLNYLDKKREIALKLQRIKLQFQQLKDILNNSYETLQLVKELNKQIEISYKNKLIDKSKYLSQKNKIIDIKLDITNKELKLIKTYINYLYLTGKIKEEKYVKLLF